MAEESLVCSFCSKSRKDVTKMIVGATKVAICNECVKLCVEILDEDITKTQNEKLTLRQIQKIYLMPTLQISNFQY